MIKQMINKLKSFCNMLCPTEKLDKIACSLSESVNELKECMDNSDLVQLKRQFRAEKNLRN